jgi:predicted ATPase
MALGHAASHSNFRRDAHKARELAEAGIALSNANGLALWSAICTTELGVAMVQSGEKKAGIRFLEEGIAAGKALSMKVGMVSKKGILALAYGETDRIGEALRLIADTFAYVHETGELPEEPELHRINGELLLMQGASHTAAAEKCFRTAIEHAQQHDAKSWELRASTNLARMLRDTGRRDEARAMLAEIYNWFTEGFDTADLKDAKALLDELSA